MMVHSGSTGDFISEAYVSKYNIHSKSYEGSRTVWLADGKQHVVCSCGTCTNARYNASPRTIVLTQCECDCVVYTVQYRTIQYGMSIDILCNFHLLFEWQCNEEKTERWDG